MLVTKRMLVTLVTLSVVAIIIGCSQVPSGTMSGDRSRESLEMDGEKSEAPPIAEEVTLDSVIAIAVGYHAEIYWEITFEKDFEYTDSEELREPTWIVQSLDPAWNVTLYILAESGEIISTRESEAPAPTPEARINHEEALRVAEDINVEIRWHPTFVPDFEDDSTGVALLRPSWVVQSLHPSPNVTVYVDAETGEAFAVRESEAPSPRPGAPGGATAR